MVEEKLKILLLEDSKIQAMFILKLLEEAGNNNFETTHVITLAASLKAIKDHDFDIILLDLNVPDSESLNTLHTVRPVASDSVIIILSADDNEELALEAVKSGAQDYLVKGKFDANLLKRSIYYGIERAESVRKIYFYAYHDILTELPNRALFMDRLNNFCRDCDRYGNKIALHMIDVDNFKFINDTYGHKYGDELLKVVAARLLQVARKTDTVARLGGDEFVIIQTHLSNAMQASVVAERIVESLSAPYVLFDKMVHSESSVGIAYYPDDTADIGELMQRADVALYSAKTGGKKRFQFYSKEAGDEIARYHYIDDQLRKNINEDEFFLLYQPQYDIQTREMIGMEALVRWNNKESGLIFPDEFIPVAEKTGLILELGTQIFKLVCDDIYSWKAQGLEPVKVAVNVSAIQLNDPTLPQKFEKIMKSYGIDVSQIDLEITETEILDYKNDECFATLTKLHEMGFSLALDDFGVGYASLNYLHKIPCSKIKIDRSFVMEIDENNDAREIIRAIILLSKALGKKLVAEGVETESHLKFLKELDCDFAQGYLLSKPVSVEDISKMLKEQKKEHVLFVAHTGH